MKIWKRGKKDMGDIQEGMKRRGIAGAMERGRNNIDNKKERRRKTGEL